jgi:MraZ protein
VFTGIYTHQIDPKGRTALPAHFRDVLLGKGTDKLFITTDPLEGCLQAFAPDEWAVLCKKAAVLPAERKRVMRLMIAPAQECPFDKVGRILLPTSLREHADLTGEVVWAGNVERIELWSPQAWKKTVDEARQPESKASLAQAVGDLY